MKLQIALDGTLADSLAILDQVADHVSIAEVGTPLIYREGVAAVRHIKDKFPSLPVHALAEKPTWTRTDLDAISYHMRQYLVLRYHLPAHAETSEALRHSLKHVRVAAEMAKHIVNSLLRCDGARFAARELSQADIALIRHTLMGLADMPTYAYSPDHPANQPIHPAAALREQPS